MRRFVRKTKSWKAGKARRREKSFCCFCLLLALIVSMKVPAAYAAENAGGADTVDPVSHPENCSAVLYDNTNGLPTSEANAIVQTADGFIWIGSY